MAKNKYIPMPTLEEYSERFKDFFHFKRENGILEVKMHSHGGPAEWSYQMHHALAELWTVIGHDRKNEVLILTSTDPYWINKWDTISFAEVEQSTDNDQRFNVQIYDTLKVVENFVNDLEIPTIAAINGKGIHWEMCLMSDITLCTPDFILQDDHFGMHTGHVPGDGMGLCLQEVLGIKRGNYMMLTSNGMDAQTCLELGVVNEVVEKGKVVKRAWELARDIMKKSRSCRRLTHQICVRPWKALIERDFRIQVLSEMYSFNLSKSSHDFEYIKYEDKQDS
ncbi:MAG: enoyl-CoA hydratase/isomerase family protein [Deltaproteobacteria bacterium]|nr:enoyl-CoA hydratase/isomerase family protein [Deltaproteobacteria bacterium]